MCSCTGLCKTLSDVRRGLFRAFWKVFFFFKFGPQKRFGLDNRVWMIGFVGWVRIALVTSTAHRVSLREKVNEIGIFQMVNVNVFFFIFYIELVTLIKRTYDKY